MLWPVGYCRHTRGLAWPGLCLRPHGMPFVARSLASRRPRHERHLVHRPHSHLRVALHNPIHCPLTLIYFFLPPRDTFHAVTMGRCQGTGRTRPSGCPGAESSAQCAAGARRYAVLGRRTDGRQGQTSGSALQLVKSLMSHAPRADGETRGGFFCKFKNFITIRNI